MNSKQLIIAQVPEWELMSEEERFSAVAKTPEFQRLVKINRKIRWYSTGSVELFDHGTGWWMMPERYEKEQEMEIIDTNYSHCGISCLLLRNKKTGVKYAECPGKYNWTNGGKRIKVN
jgi:hypothetical protein